MIASQFKAMRESLQMTQIDLAKRLKVTWRTISRWEQGAKIPETVRLALLQICREEKG